MLYTEWCLFSVGYDCVLIKAFFVIECTDTLEDADKSIFEDADPFDLEEEQLIHEIKSVLYELI